MNIPNQLPVNLPVTQPPTTHFDSVDTTIKNYNLNKHDFLWNDLSMNSNLAHP